MSENFSNPNIAFDNQNFHHQNKSSQHIMNKEEFMEQIKHENIAMNYDLFLMKTIPICFKKCISKPGPSLDKYEQNCVNRCADLYLDTWQLIGQSFQNRINDAMNNI